MKPILRARKLSQHDDITYLMKHQRIILRYYKADELGPGMTRVQEWWAFWICFCSAFSVWQIRDQKYTLWQSKFNLSIAESCMMVDGQSSPESWHTVHKIEPYKKFGQAGLVKCKLYEVHSAASFHVMATQHRASKVRPILLFDNLPGCLTLTQIQKFGTEYVLR